jgi:hypothetical protein
VTHEQTGGAPIVSYSLRWDHGTEGLAWEVVVGEDPYFRELSFIVQNGIVPGKYYNF